MCSLISRENIKIREDAAGDPYISSKEKSFSPEETVAERTPGMTPCALCIDDGGTRHGNRLVLAQPSVGNIFIALCMDPRVREAEKNIRAHGYHTCASRMLRAALSALGTRKHPCLLRECHSLRSFSSTSSSSLSASGLLALTYVPSFCARRNSPRRALRLVAGRSARNLVRG